MGLHEDDDKPDRYIVELNLDYKGGIGAAAKLFEAFYKDQLPRNKDKPAP